MKRMQEWLQRAATELGLRAEIGYVITLSDGRKIISDTWFPDLSNSHGILVFQNAPDAKVRRELGDMGFGVSSFSEPLPGEIFDIDGYAEMFAEWGWTSNEFAKPAWMDD